MRMRILTGVSGAALLAGLWAGPAGAFTAYVSNEKDNTMTVVDAGDHAGHRRP